MAHYKNKISLLSGVSFLVAASMTLAISPASAVGAPSPAVHADAQIESVLGDHASSQELEAVLGFIDSIPESALTDDATFEKWKQENLDGSMITASGTSPASNGSVSTYASGGECTWGITKFALGNAFAAAKVLKIKKVLDRAGGIKKVADEVVAAYKAARADGKSKKVAIGEASQKAATNGGEEAQALLAEVFSLDGVISGCFGD